MQNNARKFISQNFLWKCIGKYWKMPKIRFTWFFLVLWIERNSYQHFSPIWTIWRSTNLFRSHGNKILHHNFAEMGVISISRKSWLTVKKNTNVEVFSLNSKNKNIELFQIYFERDVCFWFWNLGLKFQDLCFFYS